MRIELLDAGAGAGPLRWTVVATNELGNVTTRNPAGQLDLAISTTHWHELEGRPGES